ncbi:MAG TPA: hypothetical protein VFP80_18665 [Thermoanaerobaculia bacterium]|nr:hypothetical protein [Thermoanaerobaculia bacterium]
MTRRLALVPLLATLFAMWAHAQAPSTFKEGVLAFEKGEWARAEKLMRETIAVNPRESEGTVSIAGSWFETYVPHYFLARALAKQGKCGEALQAFAETERQGVTPAIPDFARHLRTRGGCKPAPKEEKPKKVIGEVEVPFEDAPPQGAPASQPAAPPASSRQESSRAPGRQDAGVAAGRMPALREPALPDLEARVRLTTGIRAYLEGQYDVAIRVLDGKPFAGREAAAEAALFRAAARDALYRIGGEQDAGLRAAVENDLRIYRQASPKRRPDPRIFPPRFIAMANR